jgi:hypothetical protein
MSRQEHDEAAGATGECVQQENVASTPAMPPKTPAMASNGVVIGFISHLNDQGLPCVAIPGSADEALPARSLCAISAEHRGQQCALLFENGDPRAPLILGLLQHPVLSLQGDIEQARQSADGELHLHARHAIELHCGEASFRMSADGRIELRGSTLVSHATGLNRIRGASVKLN